MRRDSSPPVPQKLREMLKDYPDNIQTLQAALNHVIEEPSSGIPVYEQATWVLKDTLSSFAVDAREELRAAQAAGDSEVIERAKSKASTFGYARANMGSMSDLKAYFSARVP